MSDGSREGLRAERGELAGRRRQDLQGRFEGEFVPLFHGRTLAFDEPASTAYATLRAQARAQGLAVGDFDALIASIAGVTGFAVATRDSAPFEATGVAVVNPFDEPEGPEPCLGAQSVAYRGRPAGR